MVISILRLLQLTPLKKKGQIVRPLLKLHWLEMSFLDRVFCVMLNDHIHVSIRQIFSFHNNGIPPPPNKKQPTTTQKQQQTNQ